MDRTGFLLMLETGIALLFAHIVADFMGQTQAMVVAKRRPRVFALHIVTVAMTAALCLGVASICGLAALLVIVLSHLVIDAIKTFAVSNAWIAAAPFRALQVFALDQLAHLLFIAGAAMLLRSAFDDGAWARVFDATGVYWLLACYTTVTGFWIAVRVGDLLLAMFMRGLRMPEPAAGAHHDDRDESADQPRGGAWIGRLERSLVFLFVMLGQFNAIGFVIAAKSILRFEYARVPRQGEVVIIGTLASFGWAIAAAVLTRVGLDLLSSNGLP